MSLADDKPEATRLGSYEIVRRLAVGGMAELFLARTVGPLGFEKLVVLKKVLPHFSENPRFVQLFLDEARLAAGLDHPHIAHVYDMGMIAGNYFFTMEYVHGRDVRSVLRETAQRKQRFSIELAVQITCAVASALHHAHERRHKDGTLLGIVHRDVSPSNVVISYDGAIKLLDFGVAKAAGSSTRTRTGTLKGKVSYMSPEQASGARIDRRSDVFSLGVMLWEMVATRRLFKAENDLATIQRIINTNAPALCSVRPECPPELERIVQNALERDLERRYQTAQQLQSELEFLAREQKLNQSPIALAATMCGLFPDRSVGSEAPVPAAHATGSVTTPVSSAFDDDEDEDEDVLPIPMSAGPKSLAPLEPEVADLATEIGPPPSLQGPIAIAANDAAPIEPLKPRSRGLLAIAAGVVALIAIVVIVVFARGGGSAEVPASIAPAISDPKPAATPPKPTVTSPDPTPTPAPTSTPKPEPTPKVAESPDGSASTSSTSIVPPTGVTKRPIVVRPRPVKKPKPKPAEKPFDPDDPLPPPR